MDRPFVHRTHSGHDAGGAGLRTVGRCERLGGERDNQVPITSRHSVEDTTRAVQ